MEPDPRHAELIIQDLGLGPAGGGQPRAQGRSEPESSGKHRAQVREGGGEIRAQSKSVTTPGVKDREGEIEGEPLDAQETRRFRSLCMRANYLAGDRMDIQYACKEVARHMAKPTTKAMDKMKRLGRYLLGTPRVLTRYCMQKAPAMITTYGDADHAGCPRTRKSTSGGCALRGEHSESTTSRATRPRRASQR